VLKTQICVTRPQCVKMLCLKIQFLRIFSYSKHDGINLNKSELNIKISPTSKETQHVSAMQTDKQTGHNNHCLCEIWFVQRLMCGPGSSVGIATGYGLDSPGIESRWGGGEIFRTCLVRPWDPPNLLYNRYRVFPGGKERPGRNADPSPPFSGVGHERVEL